MHEPNNCKFADRGYQQCAMDRIKEKVTTQILDYYGDDFGNVEAKCKVINNDFEEVVNNKITYKQFLKLHPEVLYSQRRSMLYNLLRGYSTASRETRYASIYKYCVNDMRETTKLHEILFKDDACIFPDHYSDIFNSEYKLVNYINLLSEIVDELGLPMNRLGSMIVADIIRAIKTEPAYNYAPFKRIRTPKNLKEMFLIIGVDYLTPIKDTFNRFNFEKISDKDRQYITAYFDHIFDPRREQEYIY